MRRFEPAAPASRSTSASPQPRPRSRADTEAGRRCASASTPGLRSWREYSARTRPVTALGDTVNLASRLQKLAEPGTVYLSEATQRLVEGQAETAFVGEFDIKGKAEPQKVYRLDSVLPGATRFETSVFRGLSAYVGRERELQLLERQPGRGAAEILHHRCRGRTGHGEVAVTL